MKKLYVYGVILLFAVVFHLVSLPGLSDDGFTGLEGAVSVIVFVCITVSVVLAMLATLALNREAMREIEHIQRKIAKNEARQRELLREMNTLRPDIAKRLPRRK